MGSTMRAREVMVACMVSKSSVPRTLLKMADPTPNRMGAQIMRWSNQENLATLPVGVGGVFGGGGGWGGRGSFKEFVGGGGSGAAPHNRGAG